MSKKQKASPLGRIKKMDIGKYHKNNPHVSIREIANIFNVTYNQTVYAINQYKKGDLHINKRFKRKVNVENILNKNTPEQLLELQYNQCLAEMTKDDKLDLSERMIYLEKLTKVRKSIIDISIIKHIKTIDAELYARTIRRFVPNATDDLILKIYNEEFEKWKAEN